MENVGHMPHEEASDGFNRCAIGFLINEWEGTREPNEVYKVAL